MRIIASRLVRRPTDGRAVSVRGPRLVLAAFGLISSLIFAPILFAGGSATFGWVFVALAVIALGDLTSVLLRNRP